MGLVPADHLVIRQFVAEVGCQADLDKPWLRKPLSSKSLDSGFLRCCFNRARPLLADFGDGLSGVSPCRTRYAASIVPVRPRPAVQWTTTR